jgi:ATP-dependent RNA helicase DDX46/PRP5
LEKLKDGAKANSATPEPEKKPDISKVAGKGVYIPSKSSRSSGRIIHRVTGALPPKPTGFSMGSLGRIGLPLKPGSAAPKRTVAALDADDAAPERKLQKLEDLPEFDPEVQSGNAASLDAIGDDMAAEDVDEEQMDVKPDIKPDLDTENGAVPETANGSAANGHANGSTKMEVDEEEEEDELDKFMRENTLEVKQVNQADAKRQGLLAVDNESDDEPEVRDKQEDSLAKQEEMLQLAASKSRKKDLPTPDHSKIHYEPFRKAFYNPPIEALEMDEEEAELMRLEMDGIKVRGVDVPKPVKNWGAFGLPLVCLEQIRANGWTAATSIQAQAIPAIMSGRDVIGIAKTGSGKTIAFLLPLFRHVKDQRPVGGGEGPIAIIMSPTRELAMQISRECKPFLKALNLRVSCCVGGQSISEDIASMKKGAEIVVCTPGRMIDLLTANNGRVTNLRRCTYLVLDEADRMFDMGFEPQVMKIINNIRPDAQKVLFSATFPKTMEALARKILVKPLEITVGGRSVVADTIDQRVEVRDQDSKFTRLLEILGEMSEKHKEEEDFRTLIFVDRQEWADDLFRDLLQRGYVCSSLHGGKEQVDRDEAIKNFKSGDIPIIVATSVAARGLDVPQLKLVINYDAPNHMEDYVHRAGRTGRAGNTGTCITFITPEQDKFSVDIVRALEASKAFIPPELKNMSDGTCFVELRAREMCGADDESEFLEKIKAGKAKAAGSGFSGKGLERIERKREEKDRAEKHTYGDTSEALSLSSREGAVIPYKPKEQTNMFKPPERDLKNESDYTFTEIKVEIVNGPAPDKITNPALFTSGKNAMAQLPAQTLAALEKAKAEGRSVDAANLAKVVAKLTQSIELTKAEKFGLATAEGPKRTKDPDATDWHAVFPINDYPQKARWKVTNKEHMTLLSEISGASITMRGSYYSPGEEPKIGAEPKLYLLIESNDENKVRAAVDEIRRNLVEGSVAALNVSDARFIRRGVGVEDSS